MFLKQGIGRTMFLIAMSIGAACVARASDAGWPRVVNDGKNEIVVYQPQPDSLDGSTLQSRVAVSIKRPQDNGPVFGAFWVTATLSTDRDRDIAEVMSVKVVRTRFNDIPDSDVQSIARFLENTVPQWDLSLSLSRLRASLQPVDTSGGDPGYRNDPPKIIVENQPALLLLLDGPPRLQDTATKDLQVVANTALPVIYDSKNKDYWFFGSSVWFTAKDLLRGDWRAVDKAPSNVKDLVKANDTMADAQVDGQKAATADQLRTAKIIVATEPTELVVVQGSPNYIPIGAGDLLYVGNTESDIFVEVATQRQFLLLSGRWYAARTLQGPWSFISPDVLPKAFASISENSPKASVLAFVPGTDRAKDALMDNVIPQTAEVSRRDAKIDVKYDGPPKFNAIQGTSLSYATNTPSQVILASGKYFACEEGVWYSASSPAGPWQVSDVRPTGIDNIPPSSPVYNTKFTYIYSSTPDYVYVGYLPGYRWSLPYRGVVVYGTGWNYSGWYGSVYYPRPATWGFAVRYSPWNGWSFGASWSAGWWGVSTGWGGGWGGWGPVGPGFWNYNYAGGWFGPGGYRPLRPPYWRPPYRPGPYRPGYPPRPWAGGNIYNRPGRDWVHPRPIGPIGPGRPPVPGGGRPLPTPITRPDPRRPNNVFAAPDGGIHRNNGAGWEQRQGGGWRPEQGPVVSPRPSRPEITPSAPMRTEPRGFGMDEERMMRDRGAIMAAPGRGFGGGGFGGGGFGGGGGGRRR